MLFNDMGIRGMDISYGQGYPPNFPVTDFWKAKDYGMSFAIMKAGQKDYADPSFKYNWPACKGILPRHSYWYYDNEAPPKAQAEKYWSIISSDFDGMCWLDLEDRLAGNYGTWANWYDFLERLKAISSLSDDDIGIYSNYWYMTEKFVGVPSSSKQYFARYKFWMASYGSGIYKPTYESIITPAPWLTCLVLQSGTPAIGSLVGVSSGDVDYDIFNGPMSEFVKYFKVPGAPLPQGEPMFQVTASSLNVRSSAGVTSDNDLGDFNFLLNDIIETDPVKSVVVGTVTWHKCLRAWRNNVRIVFPSSPSGEYWTSGLYLTSVDFVPPPEVVMPATWDQTQVAKDEHGNVLATYKGTLTKQ